MKLVVKVRAMMEVRDILFHIARNDQFAVEGVRNRIYEVFDHFARHPYAAHATLAGNMRSIPVKPHPYVVLFRVLRKRQEVHVLRMLHGARRRPALREEETEFRISANS